MTEKNALRIAPLDQKCRELNQKYILPIGIFAIAIYIACNKEKDVLNKKLMQYTIFLICISIILSVFQISAGHINISKM